MDELFRIPEQLDGSKRIEGRLIWQIIGAMRLVMIQSTADINLVIAAVSLDSLRKKAVWPGE
jgi:hypothetical protein